MTIPGWRCHPVVPPGAMVKVTTEMSVGCFVLNLIPSELTLTDSSIVPRATCTVDEMPELGVPDAVPPEVTAKCGGHDEGQAPCSVVRHSLLLT